MKISQALLGAILMGITVQAVSSCDKKQQNNIKPEVQQPVTDASHPEPNPNQDPCPACGMG